MSDNKDTRTATQRLEDLEKVLTVVFQGLGKTEQTVNTLLGTQQDMVLVKEALRLLNTKTEAIILTAKAETGITPDAVNEAVSKLNTQSLKNQVNAWIESGQLAATDVVDLDSYVVCEEYHPTEGHLANARTQFRLDTLDKEMNDAFTGKKVGDMVKFGEDKFDAKIIEIYKLLPPKAPEAAAPAAQETAPEAPQAVTEAPATTEATATAPATAPTLNALPEESPVPVFVPSDASTMVTAS